MVTVSKYLKGHRMEKGADLLHLWPRVKWQQVTKSEESSNGREDAQSITELARMLRRI